MMGQAAHGDISDGVGLWGGKRRILASGAWGIQGVALRYLISTASPVYAVVY